MLIVVAGWVGLRDEVGFTNGSWAVPHLVFHGPQETWSCSSEEKEDPAENRKRARRGDRTFVRLQHELEDGRYCCWCGSVAFGKLVLPPLRRAVLVSVLAFLEATVQLRLPFLASGHGGPACLSKILSACWLVLGLGVCLGVGR